MKILVITDLYPVKEEEKHTPKTIYDFVQTWKTLGHSVKIIKPNFILNSLIRKKPYYRNGVYGDIENINYWTPFWGNIAKKLKQNYNPDVVVAHMPSGLIYANKLGFPFIAGVHVSDIEVLTKPIYSIYFKNELTKAYMNAFKIACRSEVLREKFLKLFPQLKAKTFVAYSGIEADIIKKGMWQKKEDKIKILTCANLIKRKNIDKVILACKYIENAELIIVGDGCEMQRLRKIADKKVQFTGYLPHNEVIEKMREADIFVLPSENETFGMVYLEAMASGCITVGLENEGISGIIKNGENGYLCKPDNIKSVLEQIINFQNKNQILDNAYNTVKNYTKDKAGKNYLNYLKQKVVNNHMV